MHTVLRTNQTAGFFNRALLEKKIITNNLLKGEGREVVLSGGVPIRWNAPIQIIMAIGLVETAVKAS